MIEAVNIWKKHLLKTACKLGRLVLVIGLFAASPVSHAQTSTPPDPVASPTDSQAPSSMAEELRIKREISFAEKEHQQNLDRAKEASDLGKDLASSFQRKNLLDREGIKKIDKLEKLAKRIRNEAGGSDDEVTIDERPNDLAAALNCIAKVSASLSDRVQETPRRVVAASIIEKANVLLELIKIVRTLTRQVYP